MSTLLFVMNILLQATVDYGPLAGPIGAGLATIGAGIGIGKIGASAMEAIGRQPEAVGSIRMSMIIAAGLVEGAALFAIVVSLLAFTR